MDERVSSVLGSVDSVVMLGMRGPDTEKERPFPVGRGEACFWFSTEQLYTNFVAEALKDGRIKPIPIRIQGLESLIEEISELVKSGVNYVMMDAVGESADTRNVLPMSDVLAYFRLRR